MYYIGSLICVAHLVTGQPGWSKRSGNCNMACPYDFTPVCGSDGFMSGNLCYFNARNCEKEANGEEVATQVDLANCQPAAGARNAVQACMKACPNSHFPVCGSDGFLSANKCYFEIRNCEKKMRNEPVATEVDEANCGDSP